MVGSGTSDARLDGIAEEVGRLLALRGAVRVSGGLGGIMEAACRGARNAGGATVGLLPGTDRSEGNRWVEIAIPTGLGEARNALVVRSADAVIAIGGEYGTLSEIALALKMGKPVIGIETWELSRGGIPSRDVLRATTAAEAVERAAALIAARASREVSGPPPGH